MPAHLENSAVATGLEKVSFIPIPKMNGWTPLMHGQPIKALSGTYSFLGLQTKGACEHGAASRGSLPWTEINIKDGGRKPTEKQPTETI